MRARLHVARTRSARAENLADRHIYGIVIVKGSYCSFGFKEGEGGDRHSSERHTGVLPQTSVLITDIVIVFRAPKLNRPTKDTSHAKEQNITEEKMPFEIIRSPWELLKVLDIVS